MPSAPTSLVLSNYYYGYLKRQPEYLTGTQTGHMAVLSWTEVETNPCFYRIERYVGSAWQFAKDVQQGVGFTSLYLPAGMTGIRITCFLTSGGAGATSSTLNVSTPTSSSHSQASNMTYSIPTSGSYGIYSIQRDPWLGAWIDFNWDDASVGVQNVQVLLLKTGTSTQIDSPRNDSTAVDLIDYNPADYGHIVGGYADIAYGTSFSRKHYNRTFYLSEVSGASNLSPDQLAKQVEEGDYLTLRVISDFQSANPVTTDFTFRLVFPVRLAGYNTNHTALNGVAYSYDFSAFVKNVITSGITFAGVTMPAGMSISSGGVFSGTPTSSGSSIAYFTATNSNGDVSHFSFNFTVSAPAIPVVTGPGTTFTFTQYQNVSVRLTATNNPTSWTKVSGTLPTGLTLDTTSGIISGTASASQSAANVVFKATNGSGDSTNYTISFTVTAVGVPTVNSASSATAYIGQAFRYPITATNNPTRFEASGLPPGLSLDGTTGVISGTPTVQMITTYSVVLLAYNATGPSSPYTLTLYVTATPISITSSNSASGAVSTPFSFQVKASGNPTTFDATGLPLGLSISSSTGVISGTPQLQGNYTVTLIVSNALTTAVGSLALSVSPPPIPVVSVPPSSPSGTVGVAFSYRPNATNAPTAWTINSPPPGLSFDPATGALSGTPSTAGSFPVQFTAANGVGTSNVATITIVISLPPAPSILSSSAPDGNVGIAYTFSPQASNSPNAWSAAPLPPGLTIDGTSGVISGTPTAVGKFQTVVTASNAGGTSAAVTFAISIEIAPRSVNRKLYLDVVNKVFVTSDQNAAPAQFAPFFDHDKENVDIFLIEPTGNIFSPYQPKLYPGTPTLRVALGRGTSVATESDTWTAITGQPGGYAGTLDLTDARVAAMLGAALVVTDAILEVEISPVAGYPDTIRQSSLTVYADLIT